MTGEIRDFRKPPAPSTPGPRILSANQPPEDVEVLDSRSEVQETPIDLRVHEEIRTEGDESIRVPAHTEIDLRLRTGKSSAEWDRVKRLEDE